MDKKTVLEGTCHGGRYDKTNHQHGVIVPFLFLISVRVSLKITGLSQCLIFEQLFTSNEVFIDN